MGHDFVQHVVGKIVWYIIEINLVTLSSLIKVKIKATFHYLLESSPSMDEF